MQITLTATAYNDVPLGSREETSHFAAWGRNLIPVRKQQVNSENFLIISVHMCSNFSKSHQKKPQGKARGATTDVLTILLVESGGRLPPSIISQNVFCLILSTANSTKPVASMGTKQYNHLFVLVYASP